MQEQSTSTSGLAATSAGELCIDEVKMVSGGFGFPHISPPHINWGGIVHTIVHNVESHNLGQVASDAARGASWIGVWPLGCSRRRRGRWKLRTVPPGFRRRSSTRATS